MRLCIATSSYPSEGEHRFAGVFVRDFARELVRRKIEVSVFTQDTGQPPVKDEGVELISFPWPGKSVPLSTLKPYSPPDVWKMLLVLRQGSKRLIQSCHQKKVDFLLAMWTLPAGYWAMNVKRGLGLPFAVWCLGSDIWVYGRLPFFKQWVRKVLGQASHCFADGISLTEEVSTLRGRPCSFLPTTRLLPREGLPELPFDPEKRHYLFVGRFHPNKGPDILLEAIHRIDPRTLSGKQFHFYGTGSLEGELRRKRVKYGLTDFVTIQGPVNEYEMAALLKKCESLIIPSRIESIPVVLSDALQLDCNLIVTDVGDMGSLIRSYGAGVVAEKPTAEALKEALLNQFRRKKGEFQEGRQKLYALFDLKTSVDTFLKMINWSIK